MYRPLFFLLLILQVQDVFSQVSGRLVKSSGQPIASANIFLLRERDSGLVLAVLSNENGSFKIENLDTGHYFLRITCIGYKTWQSPPFAFVAKGPVKDFGMQVLEEQQKELDAVVVRAKKPLYQQRPEGMVVNVESSILSKGSSALEVLTRSPGVLIDLRNNNIALNGKTGVLVMINGKLMRMPPDQLINMLSGMSANDIEKIELLTTPPASYDAEGSAGIINIVLKKNRKTGTNGSLSLTGGYAWGEKAAASLNLSHNTGKINLYGSYSFLHDRTYSNLYIDSYQNMPLFGGELQVYCFDTGRATQNNHDLSLGADIKLNSKTTIGGNLVWNSSVRTTLDINREDFIVFPDSLKFYKGSILGTNDWKNWIGSVYLEKNIREGEKINVDADYLYYKNSFPSEVQSSFVNIEGKPAGNNDSIFSPRQLGFANTVIRVGVIKVDYKKQLGPAWKLETGLKGAYTKTASGSGIRSFVNGNWVDRTETIDNVEMREGIGAAYGSLSAQLDSTANLTIGARYEYVSGVMDNPVTNQNLVTRKQGTLFPSIFFSKKLNDHAEVQLSWTKRISRPSYNDLASFVRYADPQAVFTGNPLLKPTITNNIKLGFNYRNYSFSLLFSRDKNPIGRNQLTESPQRELLYVSPQNLDWQNSLSLQANIPVKINDWWNMNYSMTGSWRQFRISYTKQPFEKTYYALTGNFSQTFRLPWSMSTEISGWYMTPSYFGTVKLGDMGALNLGIKKELKNNAGAFQLSVTDVLQTMKINVYFGAITEEAFSIKNGVYFNAESRVFPVVKLTYTKSFSSGKSSGRREGSGVREEQERVRRE